MKRNLPALAGLAGIVGSAVAADVWAVKTDRPTVSRFIGKQFERDPQGAITFGVLCALGWHLVAVPLIRLFRRS